MQVLALRARDFRGYPQLEVELGPGLTVISGPNGAGKTNLLEALYFGCTARSCRTANEREVVRFGAAATRVVVAAQGADGPHQLSVGFAPGEPKRIAVDGAPLDRLLEAANRPLVSVFLPDRLELIKGAPGIRRAHLDHLVGALWPGRVGTRRAYAQALAQRNALIGRIRAGLSARHSLLAWDIQLADHAIALMGDRASATAAVAERYARIGTELDSDEELSIAYRPRSRARTREELTAELSERIDGDLERGFTAHGPHRDELLTLRGGRDLRAFGSQGQQRIALLALLLAEREAIATHRGAAPLLLLDDVMSELDGPRRHALVRLLRASGGQAVITTTDLDHVPEGDDPEVRRLEVSAGRVLGEVLAA